MSYAATRRWFTVDPAEAELRAGMAARGVDVSVANVARIYDCLLGGKDHFEANRAAGELCRLWPPSRASCVQNRAFLGRVVRSLAHGDGLPGGRGIRQFLDIGSGLPTADNVHQIAKRADPGARVVADYDPVVVLHSKVLLTHKTSWRLRRTCATRRASCKISG